MGQDYLYQGTYKSFPLQDDVHQLAVLRYVERNSLRANIMARAEAWHWSSLWLRLHLEVRTEVPPLSDWPVARPRNWVWRVNQTQANDEVDALRQSVRRGRPFGSEMW